MTLGKPTQYKGKGFKSRRAALRAKRQAKDREGRPTLRARGDGKVDRGKSDG